jgi:CubicO group peptidase (beta-lactamase class C family)
MRRLVIPFVAMLTAVSTVAGQSGSPVPSNEEIRKILIQRIDEAKQSVGIVVGVIEPSGTRIVSYGALAKGDNRPLDGNTVFEIGSVTKVFTSLLMSDMVQRGDIALTDPISKYLPDGVKVPERGGRVISLQDLSTHTSGLPRLPTNFSPKDVANPYADYSVEQLYQFLSGYTLTRDIGAQYEYSNLGGGLLGHLLARKAGMDYEALVRSRIIVPLKMSSTGITLTQEQKSRLAMGHNGKLLPVPNWDLPTLAGAGAIRSTANDLLEFLAVPLGYTTSPLAPSFARMLSVRKPTGQPGLEVALAWHIFSRDGKDLIWHNGGTGGYRSFVGYDPKARVGVVVLSNAFTDLGVDDIGTHLLDPAAPVVPPNSPLFQAPKERKETSLDPKQFDTYVGRYQATPEILLTISREGANFFAQLTGQPSFPMFAESPKDFFFKVVDAQLTFQVDSQGRATAVVLHQLGRDQRFPRIEGEPQQAWFGHKENPIDPKVLDSYVGKYQVGPGVVTTVTNDNGHLFMQAGAAPKIEIFPETTREFFLKVVDTQFSFEVDAQGKATAVIQHMNGRDQRAPRIE